ncbi:hypothetical protein HanIR_Chr06g0294491 [Helianthus annuus]|nr:hypothetical protein HanIR_Chr06g0294491 [Helianthus annuus]
MASCDSQIISKRISPGDSNYPFCFPLEVMVQSVFPKVGSLFVSLRGTHAFSV